MHKDSCLSNAVVQYNSVSGVRLIQTPNISMSAWFSCHMSDDTIFQARDLDFAKACRVLKIGVLTGEISEVKVPEYPGRMRMLYSLS